MWAIKAQTKLQDCMGPVEYELMDYNGTTLPILLREVNREINHKKNSFLVRPNLANG